MSISQREYSRKLSGFSLTVIDTASHADASLDFLAYLVKQKITLSFLCVVRWHKLLVYYRIQINSLVWLLFRTDRRGKKWSLKCIIHVNVVSLRRKCLACVQTPFLLPNFLGGGRASARRLVMFRYKSKYKSVGVRTADMESDGCWSERNA